MKAADTSFKLKVAAVIVEVIRNNPLLETWMSG